MVWYTVIIMEDGWHHAKGAGTRTNLIQAATCDMQKALWITCFFVGAVFGAADLAPATDQPAEPISLAASLQFHSARPLRGTLLNIGTIKALVDGLEIPIPTLVVRRIEFSEADRVCYVTFTNGSRLKCELPNQRFRLTTEWGEVDVDRAGLAVIEFVRSGPPSSKLPSPPDDIRAIGSTSAD